MLDLRLLGLAMKQVPASDVIARLVPWAKAGFVIMAITGLLLFYAIPVRTYQSIFFRAKVAMLILAGLNVWHFHSRVEPRVADWDPTASTPVAALWRPSSRSSSGRARRAGRMIAYNWFDCDIQPQADLINWAAGSVPPR